MRYSHRNASPKTPTVVGHFWFKGEVCGYPIAEKVTIMMFRGSGQLRAIGIEESSKLEHFIGLWWGPDEPVAPWEIDSNEAPQLTAIDTILELLEKRKKEAWENPDSEYRHIGVINRCDEALDWLKKSVERKLYIKPEDEDVDNRYALSTLLQEELVFPNSIPYGDKRYITLYVVCNDLFAWGMADAEDFTDGDIEDLYKRYAADKWWGTQKWCCIHRNMQPQDPIKKTMIEAGVWDEEMKKLPENSHSKAIRERNNNG